MYNKLSSGKINILLRAQDWDPTKFIWSGRLKIVEKGDNCTVRFEDPNTGKKLHLLFLI